MKHKNKTYEIKPLSWNGVEPVYNEKENCSEGGYYCIVPFGSYSIEAKYHGGFVVRYCFDEYYNEGEFEAETVEEAKNKAQEDFIQRILPALEEIKNEKSKNK